MATIFTVHGTFSSGPERGDAWWQNGSSFEQDLRTNVEGVDGHLRIVPVPWDGLNSETSRRLAGVALAEKFAEADRRGEQFAVIGHSHGGSVVYASLLRSAFLKRQLPHLALWISVGTPFVSVSRYRSMFSRLGVIGKSGYLAILTFMLLLIAGIAFADGDDRVGAVAAAVILGVLIFANAHALIGWMLDRRTARQGGPPAFKGRRAFLLPRLGLGGRLLHLIVTTACVVFALFQVYESKPLVIGALLTIVATHIGLSWFQRRRERIGSPRQHLLTKWQKLWLGLHHPADEAVQGLTRLPDISFPIFGRAFAVAPLTLIAILIVPMMVMVTVTTPTLMQALARGTAACALDDRLISSDGRLIGEGTNISINTMYLFAAPFKCMFDALRLPASRVSVSLFVFIGGPILYFTLALLGVGLARLVAIGISAALASLLNSIAWSQIRSSAYGGDVLGETATGARTASMLAAAPSPLPSELTDEITRASDLAAAAAIRKLRGALTALAFASEQRAQTDVVSEYLTWDELVHTTYFKVPRFRKLICYAIAHSEGFKPSAALMADPDFPVLAAWHRDLTLTAPNAR